ncbi:hypothetical protein Tco_0846894 [Tanacetum coccineum]
MTHGSSDDMEYDPSNVEFTEWLASKFYNYKTMDHYTRMHYGFIGLEEMMKLNSLNEESSDFDDEDELNTLRYQHLKWYEALKDGKLKEEALNNKATMEWIIDKDDESSNEGWKRWDNFEYTNHDQEEREYEMEHEDEERCELFDDQEQPVYNIRRFEMISGMRKSFSIWRIPVYRTSLEKKSTKLVKYQSSGILCVCCSHAVLQKYECAGDVVDFRTWLGISIRDRNNEYYGLDGVTCLNHSGSLGVGLLNLEMIEDDWQLESKEVSFLGEELNLPVRPKELEKGILLDGAATPAIVIFDEKKPKSS